MDLTTFPGFGTPYPNCETALGYGTLYPNCDNSREYCGVPKCRIDTSLCRE